MFSFYSDSCLGSVILQHLPLEYCYIFYQPEDKGEGEGEGERQRQVKELKLSSVGFADSFANRNSVYKNVQEAEKRKMRKKAQGSKYPGGVLPLFRHTTQHLQKVYLYINIYYQEKYDQGLTGYRKGCLHPLI